MLRQDIFKFFFAIIFLFRSRDFVIFNRERIEKRRHSRRKGPMRKEASLPVRLDTDLSDRLDRVAEWLGLTKSALIRVLVKSFVDQLEASGGKITFPLRWEEQKENSSSLLLNVAETRASYGRKSSGKKSGRC